METGRWKQLISTFNNSNVNSEKKNFGKFGVSHKLTYMYLNLNPSKLQQISL